MSEKIFCSNGGCTAKLGAGVLSHILSKLEKNINDENLLVGYDNKDDGAVYKITDDIAIIQTLDFFPPMVDDPYLFGKITATNALSDIYAMGGEVKTALNIVCFPEKMDLNVLGEILKGGMETVKQANASLVGGHSINDSDIKYGLSVTGIVNPKYIYKNNTCKENDVLVLTKKLGVGIICTAKKMGEASKNDFDNAVMSMTTLNKKACEISKKYKINACTDITGFGFLGHLNEMLDEKFSAKIYAQNIPVLSGAKKYADEFFITSAGQKNRNYLKDKVLFKNIDFALEEILFDPQTAGGLLFSINENDADEFVNNLKNEGVDAQIIGKVIKKQNYSIMVEE